jgi:hypothetical protein
VPEFTVDHASINNYYDAIDLSEELQSDGKVLNITDEILM